MRLILTTMLWCVPVSLAQMTQAELCDLWSANWAGVRDCEARFRLYSVGSADGREVAPATEYRLRWNGTALYSWYSGLGTDAHVAYAETPAGIVELMVQGQIRYANRGSRRHHAHAAIYFDRVLHNTRPPALGSETTSLGDWLQSDLVDVVGVIETVNGRPTQRIEYRRRAIDPVFATAWLDVERNAVPVRVQYRDWLTTDLDQYVLVGHTWVPLRIQTAMADGQSSSLLLVEEDDDGPAIRLNQGLMDADLEVTLPKGTVVLPAGG